MYLNNEQKRAILEYGDSKYYKGYREGYISGLISGSLLYSVGIMIIIIIKEKY
jgi:hypothetical protein